jgi:hypothetical protein
LAPDGGKNLKQRAAAAGLLALTIGAGLAARYLLAGFWAKYLGVALWATAAYWCVLFVRPSLSVMPAAAVTLVASFSVELFQLTPVPAHLSTRHILFRLVLGTTFSVWDLPAYLAGAILGAAVHLALWRRP